MKKYLKISAILVALTFITAGCAQVKKVGDFVTTVTQTVTNPLGQIDIYRVKNVYAAGLTLGAEYRTYCWSKPYAALVADPIARAACQSRRAIVRKIQVAKGNASNAIRVADKFIRENPNGNAVSYVTAAWNAVQDFRATIPAVK